MDNWIWTHCKFAKLSLAGIQKDLEAEGWYPSVISQFMEIAGNNGNIVKNWLIPMQYDVNLEDIKEFMNYFRRKKEYNGKRDIFQITSADIKSFLQNNQIKEEATKSYETCYEKGNVKILRATTPEAAMALSNCKDYGSNTWCSKSLGWAKSYMREGGQDYDFFIVLYRGQFMFAMVGNQFKSANGMMSQNDIKHWEETLPDFQDVLDGVFWVVDHYYKNFALNGIWASGNNTQLEALPELYLKNKIKKQEFDPMFTKMLSLLSGLNLNEIYQQVKQSFSSFAPENQRAAKDIFQRFLTDSFKTSLTYILANGRRPESVVELTNRFKNRPVIFDSAKNYITKALTELINEKQVVTEPNGMVIWHTYANS